MSELSLGEYLQRIESLIEENRLIEAVAHCRHLLERYPRHVDSYRLLGKALLEQSQFSGAIDVFQRLLSAEPADFIAHAGLAIAYKSDQLYPLATWHLERAIEADPYNGVLLEELRSLYALQDRTPPERLLISPTALVRLHYKSEMYPQAIQSLMRLVSEDNTRMDLQTLLAQALWRDDRRVDAERVCRQILEKLPNSVTANAILAEVWLAAGRADEAAPFLKKLRQLTMMDEERLDVETPAGMALSANGAPPLPAKIMVAELDEIPMMSRESEGQEWMSALEELESREEDPLGGWLHVEKLDTASIEGIEEEVPEWLVELEGSGKLDPANAPDDSGDVKLEEALGFLSDTGSFNSAPQKDEPMAKQEDSDTLDWFSESATDQLAHEETQQEKEATGFTDWLKEQKRLEEEGIELDEADAALDELLSRTNEEEAEVIPDWLKERIATGEMFGKQHSSSPLVEKEREEEVASPPPEEVTESVSEMPAISPLSDDTIDLGEMLDAGAQPEAESELPNWLEEITAEEELAANDGGLPPATELADMPNWLQDLAKGDVDEAVSQLTSQPPSTTKTAEDVMDDAFRENVPDWMEEKPPPEDDDISDEEAAAVADLLDFANNLNLPVQDTSPLDWLDVKPDDGNEPPMPASADPPPDTEADIMAMTNNLEEIDDLGLPDWLKEMDEASGSDESAVSGLSDSPEIF